MQKLLKLIVAAVIVTSTPHVALAKEKVDFVYKPSELTNANKRSQLLERIENVSYKSCKTSSRLAPEESVERCARDLRDQFVKAIADENLTLLVQSDSRTPFRSASL